MLSVALNLCKGGSPCPLLYTLLIGLRSRDQTEIKRHYLGFVRTAARRGAELTDSGPWSYCSCGPEWSKMSLEDREPWISVQVFRLFSADSIFLNRGAV